MDSSLYPPGECNEAHRAAYKRLETQFRRRADAIARYCTMNTRLCDADRPILRSRLMAALPLVPAGYTTVGDGRYVIGGQEVRWPVVGECSCWCPYSQLHNTDGNRCQHLMALWICFPPDVVGTDWPPRLFRY